MVQVKDTTNETDQLERPRILIADDDAKTRRMIRHLLSDRFDVTLATNGEDACDQVRQGAEFDVASLDLKMPIMTGIEALKVIKEESPLTQVLIVTAYSDVDSAKNALKLGAYDYTDKPFSNDDYREAIRKGIELRQKALDSEKARESLAFVRAQLVESDKFAAIGQLIAGVSHELSNPITAILGLSELVLEGDGKDVKGKVEKIQRSALLCQNILQKLLTFSRHHESKREMVAVNDVLTDTLELKQHDFKVSRIEVDTHLDPRIPSTMADPYALQQVFLNMIHNAHQAMEEHSQSGTLTVKTQLDGNTIRIRFEDTGPGIANEDLLKIFEPLFTTKAEGKGTGLGLSICFDIIQEHQGNIYVASEPEKGACFIVELPVVTPADLR